MILWRNSTGVFETVDGRRTRAGLAKGSADLIGVLVPSGRMLALEVKRPGQRPTPEQEHWLRMVAKAGAVAAVVTSVEEAIRVVEEAQRRPPRQELIEARILKAVMAIEDATEQLAQHVSPITLTNQHLVEIKLALRESHEWLIGGEG